MSTQPSQNALRHATDVFRRHGGTLRTREAGRSGIHYATLYWMRDTGTLTRVSRGVFRLTDLPGLSRLDMVTVGARAPSATLCLLSALDFHGIGTQIPAAVNIAIGPKDRAPKLDYPPIRVYRMSGTALSTGAEEHEVDGVVVRVFNEAKTVADCFKFRNKIGLDVAVEALQEVMRAGRVTPAEILEYARIDRVENVLRPYITALS